MLNEYCKNLIKQPDSNGDRVSSKNTLFTMDMVHNNPGLLPYESDYLRPEFLKDRGYGGKVFCFLDSAQFALLWDGFDDGIFPEGSVERSEILKAKKRIRQKYIEAKEENLKVYFMMDIISLPAELVSKYADSLLTNDKIDIMKPFTKKAMDYLFDEMFEQFPALDPFSSIRASRKCRWRTTRKL